MHIDSEETLQSYSSFTSKYKPPASYEPLLVKASTTRAKLSKAYDRREQLESAVSQATSPLEALSGYVTYERRAKYQDVFVMSGVYERAIAEAAKVRFEQGSEGRGEEMLRVFWSGYCDAQRLNEVDAVTQLNVLNRALRSVPGSGDIWARYIRHLVSTLSCSLCLV